MTKRRPPTFPPGSWPPRMMADMAAAYCGERHVEDFLDRVGTVYPAPRVVDTTRRKFWYRDDLDHAMNIGVVERSSGMGARFKEGIQEKKRLKENARLSAEPRQTRNDTAEAEILRELKSLESVFGKKGIPAELEQNIRRRLAEVRGEK